MNYQRLRRIRIASQVLFLVLFLTLFFRPLHSAGPDSLSKPFFLIDPIHYLISLVTTHHVISLLMFSLIPLFLTLIFGRFFCGWVCPMGSIQTFFSFLTNGLRKGNLTKPGKSLLSVKYVLLIPVLFLPLLGFNPAGWIDPISLLTRSLSGMHEPVILLIFITIILLNIREPRLFCRVICPLGALYGLIARFRLFNWVSETSCTDCQMCSKACTVNKNVPQGELSSECLLCMNCADNCSRQAIHLRFKRAKPISVEYLPKRRVVISTLIISAAWVLLPKLSLTKSSDRRNNLVRPPGSLPESDFLERCARCGQCVQSCPTGLIQPAGIEHGLEPLWTPVCTGESGGCTWDCVNCGMSCPTGAIRKLGLKEKQVLKIGTAILDKNLCYTYAKGFNCTACHDVCPVPDNAIGFHEEEVINFRGNRVTVNQAFILTENCTGCGLCVKACPRNDRSAIQVSSESEDRRNLGF